MTAKERLKVYEWALENIDLISANYDFRGVGLCWVLWECSAEFRLDIQVDSPREIIVHFPELLNYRVVRKHSVYWFPLNKKGLNKRKQILRKIIKEMT